MAYFKKGEYQEAVKYLEEAARLLPERESITEDLQAARKRLKSVTAK